MTNIGSVLSTVVEVKFVMNEVAVDSQMVMPIFFSLRAASTYVGDEVQTQFET